ncbi:MAG: epoxyqueuosine reductase QueH, partial [Lachnospiraceae bacterium]|nr:epoxyqueuosine reductase QueH [Lachnospiraceae bacterium]
MNAVRNYQKELDNIITALGEDGKEAPTLFLHSCCAPCSSYVLEYLRK